MKFLSAIFLFALFSTITIANDGQKEVDELQKVIDKHTLACAEENVKAVKEKEAEVKRLEAIIAQPLKEVKEKWEKWNTVIPKESLSYLVKREGQKKLQNVTKANELKRDLVRYANNMKKLESDLEGHWRKVEELKKRLTRGGKIINEAVYKRSLQELNKNFFGPYYTLVDKLGDYGLFSAYKNDLDIMVDKLERDSGSIFSLGFDIGHARGKFYSIHSFKKTIEEKLHSRHISYLEKSSKPLEYMREIELKIQLKEPYFSIEETIYYMGRKHEYSKSRADYTRTVRWTQSNSIEFDGDENLVITKVEIKGKLPEAPGRFRDAEYDVIESESAEELMEELIKEDRVRSGEFVVGSAKELMEQWIPKMKIVDLYGSEISVNDIVKELDKAKSELEKLRAEGESICQISDEAAQIYERLRDSQKSKAPASDTTDNAVENQTETGR